MNPQLNAPKMTDSSCCFVKKSKKHLKNKVSLVTEVDKPKTSCNIVKSKSKTSS